MNALTQQKIELIVDVLTFFHYGEASYSSFATEQVKEETISIHLRYKNLKSQGIPGLEAVRRAKIEWVTQITME